MKLRDIIKKDWYYDGKLRKFMQVCYGKHTVSYERMKLIKTQLIWYLRGIEELSAQGIITGNIFWEADKLEDKIYEAFLKYDRDV